MMLWDIIRDWFVMYIFGGISSNEDIYGGNVGIIKYSDASDNDFLDNNGVWVNIMKNIGNGDGTYYDGYITLADWLSTTSTIIVLILMCVFLFLCVRYLFKVGAGLFSNLRG